jgi:hypothetical protein
VVWLGWKGGDTDMGHEGIFSENLIENLALLWVKQQDIKGKKPVELFELFQSAYEAIEKAKKVQDTKNAEKANEAENLRITSNGFSL